MTIEINIRHGRGVTPVLVGNGLLARLGVLVREQLHPSKVAVITEEKVAPLYLASVKTTLETEGFQTDCFILPGGETTKSFAHLEGLMEGLLEFGLDRSDCIVALGGGVIGDLAGLAASLFKRGVHLVQVPTTLLSQVDSSVGGKTGINTSFGKNLIGTFYQSSIVVADVGTLKTLPKGEFCSGYAEVVKHAILDGEQTFKGLEDSFEGFFNRDPKILAKIISASIKLKTGFVEADEREAGQRMLLNLGHTFGHGLEVLGNYSALKHGEAVSIGICLAFQFAISRGVGDKTAYTRVKSHLEKAGLPTNLKDVGLDISRKSMIEAMKQDKKKGGQGFRLVLPCAIGDVMIKDGVSTKTLDDFLKTLDF